MSEIKAVSPFMSVRVTDCRRYVYAVAVLTLLTSILSLVFRGLNVGIDFQGGMLIEIRSHEKIDIAALRLKLSHLSIGEFKLQEVESNKGALIRVHQTKERNLADQQNILDRIKISIGNKFSYQRVEAIGPKVSRELIKGGVIAFFIAIFCIFLYILIRFSWVFGICGTIALFHDTFTIVGFYSLSAYEFNETALLVILTTVSYSINSSVIVYDRIRENIRNNVGSTIFETINISVTETLSRTIITVTTTLLSLLALYFLGGPVISEFSLPLIIGITLGACSSTFISTNLITTFLFTRKDNSLEMTI